MRMEKLVEVTHFCPNLRQMGILMHKRMKWNNKQPSFFFSNIHVIYYVIKKAEERMVLRSVWELNLSLI